MNKGITRRDFLKLTGALPITIVPPRFLNALDISYHSQDKPPNVIIVVFDAFSAFDASLYGFERATTPNLVKLAERAVVYHNHYAGGNFTTPGTASLLSGMLPWKHRQFTHFGEGGELFIKNNLFSAFENYYRLACTHNPLANDLLNKLDSLSNIDNHIPSKQLFLTTDGLISNLFSHDEDIASVSWVRAAKKREEGFAYSLFFAQLYDAYQERKIESYKQFFPRGLPNVSIDNYYLLENAIDFLGDELIKVPQPFIGYLHLMPPHAPYKTHLDFYDYFKKDGLKLIQKPLDIFAREEDARYERVWQTRTGYDEFILYADREFGRFFESLEKSGILANTWVVLTSDHGEMFERGILKHTTPVLYEPIIRVPLMIFEPGRETRTDIYSNTSAVDLLPTLLHVTGQRQANWTEGVILPPFVPKTDTERNVHTIQAKFNKQYKPISEGTVTLVKDHYKLQYFFGYDELGGPGSERIELYNLKNDPDELSNLSTAKRETTAELLNELKQKMREMDEPYL